METSFIAAGAIAAGVPPALLGASSSLPKKRHEGQADNPGSSESTDTLPRRASP
jgi:hypothetical protein